jgi:hypothetical protein
MNNILDNDNAGVAPEEHLMDNTAVLAEDYQRCRQAVQRAQNTCTQKDCTKIHNST